MKFKGRIEIEPVNGQMIATLTYGWLKVSQIVDPAFSQYDQKKQRAIIECLAKQLQKRIDWKIKNERAKLKTA